MLRNNRKHVWWMEVQPPKNGWYTSQHALCACHAVYSRSFFGKENLHPLTNYYKCTVIPLITQSYAKYKLFSTYHYWEQTYMKSLTKVNLIVDGFTDRQNNQFISQNCFTMRPINLILDTKLCLE